MTFTVYIEDTSTVLAGRIVAVVHEDTFTASYLADVISRAGATVLLTFPVQDGTSQLFNEKRTPVALVLSDTAPDVDALTRAASARSVATVAVRPARSGPLRCFCADQVLTTPCGAFQVVNAIADILSSRETRFPSFGRQLRGH